MRKPYSFDGEYVRDRHGKKLLLVDDRYIREYPSRHKLVEIDDDLIREYPSRTKLLTFDGENIREYPSHRKMTTIAAIREEIEGVGGITLVGIWYLLTR